MEKGESEMNTLTLLPPTFRNGPPLCAQTRLPAFETEDALRHFYGSLGDGVTITRIGRCSKCGGFHAETHHRSQRESKIPERIKHATP